MILLGHSLTTHTMDNQELTFVNDAVKARFLALLERVATADEMEEAGDAYNRLLDSIAVAERQHLAQRIELTEGVGRLIK